VDDDAPRLAADREIDENVLVDAVVVMQVVRAPLVVPDRLAGVRATREDARRPLDDIKPFQKRQIERGAQVWLRMLDNPEITYRFDVVEVIDEGERKPRCELVEDAFQLATHTRH